MARVGGKGLHYLRPMWPHLTGMFLGFAALAVILVPVGLLLVDLLWTRILLGSPLTVQQAEILRLAVEPFTSEALTGPQRHEVLNRWLELAAFAFGLGVPGLLSLYAYRLWILQKINQTLRLDILDRLQSLSLRFHKEHTAGDAIYRMVQDAATVSRFLESLVITPIGAVAQFLLQLGIVSLFDPRLTGLLLAIWLPLTLLAWFRTGNLRHGLLAARAANARVTTRVQELAAALPVVKACGSEDWDAERFEEESRRSFQVAHSARIHVVTYEIQIYWVLGAAMVIAFAAGAVHTRSGHSTSATILGIHTWTLGLWTYFCARFAQAGTNARSLFVNWGRAQDVFAGLGRVFDLLDRAPDLTDAPDAVDLPTPREGVRLRSVSFRYDAGRAALDGVDFFTPIGSITAIVGPSGAGKSTLLSLLLRLADPDSGSIEIDGLALSRVRRASLREQLAIALQEPLLFGGTIADNIRWAAPAASDARVEAAARVACAHDFIQALPQGYETPLGERGVKLSTGQRQRLSIARAILKNPSILLLDEPTAALDVDTERKLVASLTAWGRDRTLFIVTHRPATAAMADQILALAHGRVQDRPAGETPS
ncbi:MAG: ABC transporter ATP-binding protein [Candidatus Binatia bacterium]|nr:ABC transporter ATP-binding protein [Candidatus Binatia bacterium]